MLLLFLSSQKEVRSRSSIFVDVLLYIVVVVVEIVVAVVVTGAEEPPVEHLLLQLRNQYHQRHVAVAVVVASKLPCGLPADRERK